MTTLSEVISNNKKIFNGTLEDEFATSTNANETFKLGGGNNKIIFSEGNGKDVVYSAGTDTLMFETGEQTYTRKGNDIIITNTIKNPPIALTKAGKNQFKYGEYVYNIDKTNKVVIGRDVRDGEIYDAEKGKIYSLKKGAKEPLTERPANTKNYTKIDDKWYLTSDLNKPVNYVEEVRAGVGQFEYKGYIYDEDAFVTKNTDVIGTVTIKDYLKKVGQNITIGEGESAKALTAILNDLNDKQGIIYGSEESKKALTLNGSFLNETFYGGNKSDKIYTGAGNDNVNTGKGNDTIYVNGEGKKTLEFDKFTGKDVVNITNSDAEVILDFEGDKLQYARNGNDIIISASDYMLEDNEVLASNGKIYKYNNSTKDVVIASTVDNERYFLSKDRTLVYDILGATSYTFEENDDTTGYLELGGKYYLIDELGISEYVPKEDEVRAGKGEIEADGYIFKVKNGYNQTVDTVTLKNYLNGGQNVLIKTEDGTTSLIDELNKLQGDNAVQGLTKYGNEAKGLEYNKSQTLKGSMLNETFIGGKKADKIYTGAGDDNVTAGAGNDTIYVNGTGEKTLEFNKGDGNDIVSVSAEADIKLNFDDDAMNYIYTVSGKDLVVSRDYITGSKTTTEKVTVKNYNDANSIKINGADIETLDIVTPQTVNINGAKFYGTDNADLYNIELTKYKNKYIHDTTKIIDGVGNDIYNFNKYNKYLYLDVEDRAGDDVYNFNTSTGIDNCVNIFDDNGNDTYNIKTFNNNIEIFDEKGNNTYNITSLNNSIRIINEEGNDTINLGMSAVKVAVFFNIDGADSRQYQPELYLMDSTKMASVKNYNDILDYSGIYIDNYFPIYCSSQVTINTTEAEGATDVASIESRINSITSAVQGWLADYNYNDTYTVFEDGTRAEIDSLMNVYQTGTYTPKTQV